MPASQAGRRRFESGRPLEKATCSRQPSVASGMLQPGRRFRCWKDCNRRYTFEAPSPIQVRSTGLRQIWHGKRIKLKRESNDETLALQAMQKRSLPPTARMPSSDPKRLEHSLQLFRGAPKPFFLLPAEIQRQNLLDAARSNDAWEAQAHVCHSILSRHDG